MPVRPVRGQILRLRDPAGPGLVHHVLRFDGGYLVPRPDGRYALGATVEERGYALRTELDDVYELLRSTNTALCIADTEAGTTPEVTTADFGYVRLRDEGYSDEGLREWAKRIQALGSAWTDAYVFFKHEEKGVGPKLARDFLRLAPDTASPPTPESE